MDFESAIDEIMNDYGFDDREEAVEMYVGEYTTFEEYAWEIVEDSVGIDDWFLGYVDIEKFANDLHHDYVVIEGFGCVHVFHA